MILSINLVYKDTSERPWSPRSHLLFILLLECLGRKVFPLSLLFNVIPIIMSIIVLEIDNDNSTNIYFPREKKNELISWSQVGDQRLVTPFICKQDQQH